LVIGNSLTDANVYPAELYRISGGLLKFIGTRDTGSNSPNEGYSGKTFEWFVSDSCSPFVQYKNGKFDIKTYLEDNNFNKPNLITIMLGINDFIRGKSKAKFDSITAYCDTMISNFISLIPLEC